MMRSHLFTYFLILVLAFVVAFNVDNSYKMLESDPFTIKSVDSDIKLIAYNRKFIFKRHVCTTKDLIISTQREIISLKDKQKTILPTINYTAYASDGCYDATFVVELPDHLKAGTYIYRPVLRYDINEVLSKTKPAPTVKFRVLDLK